MVIIFKHANTPTPEFCIVFGEHFKYHIELMARDCMPVSQISRKVHLRPSEDVTTFNSTVFLAGKCYAVL
jgi:hypothetical protein